MRGLMTDEVKEFIELNIDLIENNEWNKVYDNATIYLDSESTGGLTQVLLDIGIDPLQEQHLDYIPEYYLSGAAIDTFVIPSYIQELQEGCFSYSDIKELHIPEGVRTIGKYAFYECLSLHKIFIPSSVEDILDEAFDFTDGVVVYCSEGSYAHEYAMQHDMEVKLI